MKFVTCADFLFCFSFADDTAKGRKTLPENWNTTTTYNYAFRFAHTQSALHYLVKISRLSGKAVINGLGIGDDKVHTVDFVIKDYLSESSFPFTLPTSSSSGNDDDDSEQKARSLQHLYISPGRLADLATLFKLQIIQKLAPALQKEGYEESAHAASQREPQRIPPTSSPQDPLREDRLPRPPPPSSPFAQPDAAIYDPITGLPSRPYPAGDFPPPGFEDEYEINRPLARGGLGGERRPLNIGERDLYPPGLGPHDPLRSGGGGGFIAGGGGGGMHPTFDDPIFGGGRGGAGGGQGTGVYDGRYVKNQEKKPPLSSTFQSSSTPNPPTFLFAITLLKLTFLPMKNTTRSTLRPHRPG